MFIKKLMILNENKKIRELKFHYGLNLIIDNTPETEDLKKTGNNVGKTTVLKLIYFCLGGKASEIYTDNESNKIYKDLYDFLINQKISIKLILAKDLDSSENEIIIERNFLRGKEAKRIINDLQLSEKEFENKLSELIFPDEDFKKPTFKEKISHNFRYKDSSINRTLRTLDVHAKDVEYESLYLYLLNLGFNKGESKQKILEKLKQENTYKTRLLNNHNKNFYEINVSIIESEIEELIKKRNTLNINENFENDLKELNQVKYQINKLSSTIEYLNLRKNLILEAVDNLEKKESFIEIKTLKTIYLQTNKYVPDLQKTFEDLLHYHNSMLKEKISFIKEDLPSLEQEINNIKKQLNDFLTKEKELSLKIAKSDSFEDLEKITNETNLKFNEKGKIETILEQIKVSEEEISSLEKQLSSIDNDLYSSDFQKKLKNQINKFNNFFAKISNDLYGEKYAMTYSIETSKATKKQIYKFDIVQFNSGSGKKQGEILCFDLAYILFAKEENIPNLQFLLNDKKELMHDNQLIKINDFIKKNNIQLVFSILKDKLPKELLDKSNIILELSQDEKLFKF